MKNYRSVYFSDPNQKNFISNQINKLNLKEEGLVVFLSEECVTLLNSDQLNKFYRNVSLLLEDYDIFYLTTYLDDCEKLENVTKIDGIQIKRTFSPSGFDALVTTKKKWLEIEYLLQHQEEKNIEDKMNTLISRRKIKALTSLPRIFEKNSNVNYCRNELSLPNLMKNEKNMSFYYFSISSVMCIVFLIYLIKKL
tara:strand:- start:1182 stop:1766 length:585 start_codon:yes stop_codon:yes gene_type:complete